MSVVTADPRQRSAECPAEPRARLEPSRRPIASGRRVTLLAVHHVEVDGQTLTGGAEKYICMTAKALVEAGAAVHIGYSGSSIYRDMLQEISPDQLTVERTGWLDSSLAGDSRIRLATIRQRRRWLRATNADTVLAIQQAGGAAFAASLLAAKSLGLRVVSSIRQMPGAAPPATSKRWLGVIPSPQLWRRRLLWRQRLPAWCCDALIFNCRRAAEAFAQEWGFARHRFHVIYNGEPPRHEEQHFSQEGPRRIATVGRVTEAKGADTLLAAFSFIAQKHRRCRLAYYGDGPLIPALKDKARRLGLSDRIDFAGYQKDHERIYADIDIYVQVSRREALANSVIEAMSRGIPCLVSDVGGLPETVIDGESGLVIPKDDPQACADTLLRLMADRAAYHRLSSAAAERARRMFDLAEFQRRTVETVLGI